jgi:hypothetical protein
VAVGVGEEAAVGGPGVGGSGMVGYGYELWPSALEGRPSSEPAGVAGSSGRSVAPWDGDIRQSNLSGLK